MGRGKRRGTQAASTSATGATKVYRLLGRDGRPYESSAPGSLGGHRGNRIYGRLDCPSARQWIAAGYYVKQRVFFKDEETALQAGYRPCGCCLPGKYRAWKDGQDPRLIAGGEMRTPPPLRVPSKPLS